MEQHFRVTVDISDLLKTKKELEELKSRLKNINAAQNPKLFDSLNNQLAGLSRKYKQMSADYNKEQAEISRLAKKAQTDVLGTYQANVKRLADELTSLQKLKHEKTTLAKAEKSGMISSQEAAKQRALLVDQELKVRNAITEVRQTLNNQIKTMNAADGSAQALALSLTRMQAAYERMNQAERGTGTGEALAIRIAETERALASASTQMGATGQATVRAGNRFNMLSYNIQQVARELPAITYGAQTFFMAISNNIPMLADEIKRARIEYEMLKKSGQKAVPVWKQVIKSIFSWQTALVAGITVLTLYYKEIGEWTKGLFNSKSALDELRDARMKQLEAEKEAYATALKSRVELESNIKLLKEFNGSKEDEKKKIEELNSRYGDVFGHYKTLSDWYDTLITKAGSYTETLFLQAKAERLISNAVEADAKMREIEAKGPESYRPFFGQGGKLAKTLFGITTTSTGSDPALLAYRKAREEAAQAKNEAINEAMDIQRQIQQIRQGYGIGGNKASSITGEKLKEYNATEMIRQEIDLQFQVEQARIDALKEGSEKTLAQMKLNHTKELEELKREKENYLAAIIENEKEKFEADPKNKGKKFDSSGVRLSIGQTEAFDMLDKSIRQRQTDEERAFYEKQISDYKTYAEKRLEAIKKYQSDRETLEKSGASQESFDILDSKRDDTLSAIDKEFAGYSENFETWMNGIANMTLDQLVQALETAKLSLFKTQAVFKDINDPARNTQEVAVLRAQIDALNKQISSLQGKKSNSNRTVSEWKDLQDVLSKVNKEIDDIGKNIGGATGEILSFAGSLATQTMSMISSITRLGELSVKGIGTAATAAARAVQTVEKASVILAAVSAALQIMDKIKSFFSTSEATQYELDFLKSKVDLQNKFNEALVRQIALQKEMFGGDAYGNALASVKAYYKALENYEEQYQNAVFYRSRKKHSGGLLGKINPFYGAAVKALSGSETYEVNARENMQIQTRHKTWFRSAKYQNLEDWLRENGFGNLFNKDGELNLDLAKSVLDMKGLTDETKNFLTDLISAQEQVEEMNEALRDYIDNTFGSLGDSMTDAIVDAFKNGSDAAETFKKDVVGVLEEVGAQMARSLFMQKYIDSYADSLEDIFKKKRTGSEQDNAKALSDEIMQVTNTFFQGMTAAGKQSEEFLKWFTESGKKYGFDLFQPDEEAPSSSDNTLKGAFAKASQESIDLLAGQFGAMRIDMNKTAINTDSIQANMSAIFELSRQKLDEMKAIRALTDKIEKSNTQIAVNTAKINDLAKSTEGINQGIKDISNHGLYMK